MTLKLLLRPPPLGTTWNNKPMTEIKSRSHSRLNALTGGRRGLAL